MKQKFVKEFTKATVKGWKGLKLKYLEDLILSRLKGQDPERNGLFTRECKGFSRKFLRV